MDPIRIVLLELL